MIHLATDPRTSRSPGLPAIPGGRAAPVSPERRGPAHPWPFVSRAPAARPATPRLLPGAGGS